MTFNFKDWFQVAHFNDHLWVIRERLDEIEPRFLTKFTNMFLLLGTESALLVDTGAGAIHIKPVIKPLVGSRNLIVCNTHSDFDHIGGNEEFEEIFIHPAERELVSKPYDVSYLQCSSKTIIKNYARKKFVFQPAKIVKPMEENHLFRLGDLDVTVIHTPGHTPGSSSLITTKGELFTGDSAHFGAIFLPKRVQCSTFVQSLDKLSKLCLEKNINTIFPSHEQFPVDKALFSDIKEGVQNIHNIWKARIRDDFLRSWIVDTLNFKFVLPFN